MGHPQTHDIVPARAWGPVLHDRRIVIVSVLAYAWLRVGFILSSTAFETPDTASYRSGQGTRPPLSAALLSTFGDTAYVLLSAILSTAGFIALAWALWDSNRRRWSYIMVAVVTMTSLLPMVSVYEHWLVPDSLITGLALIALALASRRIEAAWYPWTVLGLCTIITLTKEVGVGIVVLVALVLAVRRSYRLATVAVLTSALLFAVVVLPASGRPGRVIWDQPLDTEITMERFRVIIAGVMWSDLSPELTEVKQAATTCGMTPQQLIAETFRLTDRSVDFRDCPDLWQQVDAVSQVDVLTAHLRNPVHVGSSVQRGFVPDMYAMSHWSGYPVDQPVVMALDRFPAGAVALMPISVLLVALACRRGRRLAAIATLGSTMALVAALIDPSSQDRHTLVFRVAALGISLLALTEATDRLETSNEVPSSSTTRGDRPTGASDGCEQAAPDELETSPA